MPTIINTRPALPTGAENEFDADAGRFTRLWVEAPYGTIELQYVDETTVSFFQRVPGDPVDVVENINGTPASGLSVVDPEGTGTVYPTAFYRRFADVFTFWFTYPVGIDTDFRRWVRATADDAGLPADATIRQATSDGSTHTHFILQLIRTFDQGARLIQNLRALTGFLGGLPTGLEMFQAISDDVGGDFQGLSLRSRFPTDRGGTEPFAPGELYQSTAGDAADLIRDPFGVSNVLSLTGLSLL